MCRTGGSGDNSITKAPFVVDRTSLDRGVVSELKVVASAALFVVIDRKSELWLWMYSYGLSDTIAASGVGSADEFNGKDTGLCV